MSETRLPLLLVEDEINVGSTLQERLDREGFAVTWAKSCAEARAAAERAGFALALLDVGLPDGSGFDVARLLRERRPETAIVFVTAFGSPESRVEGLELGAEDYIVKPFHFRELLLRIRNAVKRAESLAPAAPAPDAARIGRARVDFARFEAMVDGEVRRLTHKECALLRLLAGSGGRVVSRDEILDTIWKDEFPSTRTVDNFILRLRKLVEEDPANPRIILSVRGVGYQLAQKESP